jgi:ABC-2 type transport system permease protein
MVIKGRTISKYWYIFSTQINNNLTYPAELIGRSLIILPFMWIFFQLWKVTFNSAAATTINGLTFHDTMWYLMLTETIELSRPRIANTISEAVREGSIVYFLNKPYDFLLYHFSTSMGEIVFRASVNILLGGSLVWLLVGPPPSAWGWPMVVIIFLGAAIINFSISAMIGLTSFVVEDVTAFQWIYQKLAFILGGLLIPIDFYPQWLQVICKALPFSSMTYAPARLFIAPSTLLFINTLAGYLSFG